MLAFDRPLRACSQARSSGAKEVGVAAASATEPARPARDSGRAAASRGGVRLPQLRRRTSGRGRRSEGDPGRSIARPDWEPGIDGDGAIPAAGADRAVRPRRPSPRAERPARRRRATRRRAAPVEPAARPGRRHRRRGRAADAERIAYVLPPLDAARRRRGPDHDRRRRGGPRAERGDHRQEARRASGSRPRSSAATPGPS